MNNYIGVVFLYPEKRKELALWIEPTEYAIGPLPGEIPGHRGRRVYIIIYIFSSLRHSTAVSQHERRRRL